MISRRRFVTTVAISSIALPSVVRAAVGAPMPAPPVPTSLDDPDATLPMKLIAVGDIQRANFAEQIFMSRQSNDPQRRLVLGGVLEESPDFLLLLGDQVAEGASSTEWEYFDGVFRHIRATKTPTMAILGNHDYSSIDNKRALRESYARWPELQQRPHLRRRGPIAIIGVDTNMGWFSEDEIAEQAERYSSMLDELDRDPSVRAVIVCAHHPPYSNSALGGDARVEELFAQPFLKASKTRLFLSGHVHSYERFTDAATGKYFVISGGGGGPRRTIDVSSSRRYHNDQETLWLGRLRPFNFLRINIESDGITVESMMLQGSTFKVGDRFGAPLAAMPVAATANPAQL